jgi:hypothetical protein
VAYSRKKRWDRAMCCLSNEHSSRWQNPTQPFIVKTVVSLEATADLFRGFFCFEFWFVVVFFFQIFSGLAKDRVVASSELLNSTTLTGEKIRELLEYSRRSLQIDEWSLKDSERNNKQSLCCSTRCEAELLNNNDDDDDGNILMMSTKRDAAKPTSLSHDWWLSNSHYRHLKSIYEQTNDSDAVRRIFALFFE